MAIPISANSSNSTGLVSSINLPTKEAVNSLVTGKLPLPGTWYYPNSGINSVIFPDFFKANQTPSTSTDSNGSGGSSNGEGKGVEDARRRIRRAT